MTRYYLPTQQAPQPAPNLTPWIILLVCVLLLQWSHQAWPFNGPNDSSVVVVDPKNDPPTPAPPKPKIGDTYVVRVYETETSQNPTWLVSQVQNDKFWLKWLKAESSMGLHTFDPQFADGKPNPQAESFVRAAAAKSIKPPFWMHVQKGGNVLSITPFSESVDETEWKKIIESGVIR